MRDSSLSLVGALERDRDGVAIVWCPDLNLREELVEEVESLVPTSAAAFRTTSVEEAIAAPTRMALVVPQNESEVVLDLDGSRDRLLDETHPRTQPVVLFLVRDGDGQRALAEQAPGLRSWVAGSDVDTEALATIDVAEERRRFERRHGRSPEAWLAEWRRGAIPATGRAFSIAYWAMLLEAP